MVNFSKVSHFTYNLKYCGNKKGVIPAAGHQVPELEQHSIGLEQDALGCPASWNPGFAVDHDGKRSQHLCASVSSCALF